MFKMNRIVIYTRIILRSVLKTCIHVLYRNGGLNAIWKILDGTIIKRMGGTLAYLVLKELLNLEILVKMLLLINRNESLIQLGDYNGLPFFVGMRYSDAGKPDKLVNTSFTAV